MANPGGERDAGRRSLLRDQLQVCLHCLSDTVATRLADASAGASQLEEGDDGEMHIGVVSDQLEFDKGFYAFVRAIQMLRNVRDRVVVVGLAGPSGAGKTVFSQKINDFVPGCSVLSMDMYNRGDLVVDGNFDDPRLTDYEVLLSNIRDLKRGLTIQSPIYDFKTSSRIGWRTVEPPSVVILEGIYALSNELRPEIDLRVSIRGGVHLDLVKRVLRDVQRSGQEPEAIINQISETVFPMYKAFIEPDLQAAQLRIVNRFNPFHGFHNPTFILKSDRQVTEEQIRSCLSNNVSVEVADLDDIYLLPPGECPTSCQTWLRMRNRDGRYTLMFEEYVTDGPFIVSPRVKFEVSVRVLGGLMALGYETWCVMRRHSKLFADSNLQVKLVDIDGMGRTFVQVQGSDRQKVAELGSALGVEGRYLSSAYIDLARAEGLTSRFRVTDEYKQRLVRRSSLPAPSRASSWNTEGSGECAHSRCVEDSNGDVPSPRTSLDCPRHDAPSSPNGSNEDDGSSNALTPSRGAAPAGADNSCDSMNCCIGSDSAQSLNSEEAIPSPVELKSGGVTLGKAVGASSQSLRRMGRPGPLLRAAAAARTTFVAERRNGARKPKRRDDSAEGQTVSPRMTHLTTECAGGQEAAEAEVQRLLARTEYLEAQLATLSRQLPDEKAPRRGLFAQTPDADDDSQEQEVESSNGPQKEIEKRHGVQWLHKVPCAAIGVAIGYALRLFQDVTR
jgi:uridine kinase